MALSVQCTWCPLYKEHLTLVNADNSRLKTKWKTNLLPILSRSAHSSPPLYSVHSLPSTACPELEWNTERATSLSCLLWHNGVWLLPDFPSCPLAWWGNCHWWLVAILPQQSGEGQDCLSATLSSWSLLSYLLLGDTDMSGKFTCRTTPPWLLNNFKTFGV